LHLLTDLFDAPLIGKIKPDNGGFPPALALNNNLFFSIAAAVTVVNLFQL
jgi:hypothetical protein